MPPVKEAENQGAHESPERVDAEDVFGDELSELVTDALDDDDDDDDEGGESPEGEGGEGGEGGGDDEETVIDLDDDEDDDEERDDEGEPGAEGNDAAEGAEATAGKEGEQARGADGKFVKADAAPAGGEQPKADAPKWQPMAVLVDKQNVAIPEAHVIEQGEHMMIAIPKKDFARYQQRIGRGIVGERLWRELDKGLKELDAKRNAPARKSDAEIEAELILELVKPLLEEVDPRDVENVRLKAEVAKRDEAARYEKNERERVAAATAPSWEEQQSNGIGTVVLRLVNQFPELRGLDKDELMELYRAEFKPVASSLYWKDKDGRFFANEEYIARKIGEAVDRKNQKAQQHAKPAAGGAPSAPSKAPAQAGHPATPAKGDRPKTDATTKGERFNRGVESGAAPRTTSVKANRGTRPPQKRTTRERAGAGRRELTQREKQIRAEDRARKVEAAYMASTGLDFDLPPDDDEE